MRTHVTFGVRKVGRRRAPRARVRLLGGYVGRNRVPPELPHPDALVTPLHRHHAAAGRVVEGAEAAGRPADTAAGIAVGGIVAVLAQRLAAHDPLDAHPAVICGVKGHLVAVGSLVDRLHDVDFAIVRPVVRVGQPERRPRAAAVGGMFHIEDEQTLVVLRLGLEPDGETTCRCIWV